MNTDIPLSDAPISHTRHYPDSSHQLSNFVRKFCKQPASIVSFRQMQTFDQYLLFVAERHCLQMLQ